MKRDATKFVRNKLIERNPVFEKFTIEMTLFKKLKTDFMYCPVP